MEPTQSYAFAVLYYGFPLIVLVYYVTSTIVSACYMQSLTLKKKDENVRRDIILWFMLGLVCSYFIHAAVILSRLLLKGSEQHEDYETVSLIASAIVSSIEVLAVADAKFPVWYPYYGSWIIGCVFEMLLVIMSAIFSPPKDAFDVSSTAIRCTRICLFLALLSLYAGFRNSTSQYHNVDEEQQSLLRARLAGNGEQPSPAVDYGGTKSDNKPAASPKVRTDDDIDAQLDAEDAKKVKEEEDRMYKRLSNDGNLWTYIRGFSIFLPHMWPSHDKLLQFRAFLVIGCLLATNFLNVVLPVYFGIVVDLLTTKTTGHEIWVAAAIYACLLFLSQGVIGWIRFWLWLPVEQYAEKSVLIASHHHVMSLSSDFHDSRESFEVHQALSSGYQLTNLVDTVFFQILPMMVDLCLAAAFLCYRFGPYLFLVVSSTALTFIYTTTKLVTASNKSKRKANALSRRKWRNGYQSVDGWATASLFNNIGYEENKYARSTGQALDADYVYSLSSRAIEVAQSFIMTFGLLTACFLAIYQVLYGQKSPGDFAALFMYWAQLRSPLSFFSRLYKTMSGSMMEAERLLELLQTKPTIIDQEDAQPLKFEKGEVRFSNVSYSYDSRKPGLKDLDFVIQGGTTVALVGETGGGKSTVLKLLNRFYDVNEGSITIDGQDIRDVPLESLRAHIGTVPQDPSMFDASIYDNVAYGKLNSTMEEVHEACKAAAIHDKIMSFPDGYFSMVGRRGVKLSGGERQRLAIARTMLKKPAIILLDEATSAIDTETESLIQEAFRALCKGRTTVVVAHRLSTIMQADRIMVIKEGKVIENGTHEELIHQDGKYNSLWLKQITVKSARDFAGATEAVQKYSGIIVNDIDLKAPTKELGKLLRTTTHPERPKSLLRAATDVVREKASARPKSLSREVSEGNFTPGGLTRRNRESSSVGSSFSPLRATAPSFEPHSRTSTDEQDSSTAGQLTRAQLTSKLKVDKAEKKQLKNALKKVEADAKKSRKKVDYQLDGLDEDSTPEVDLLVTEQSEENPPQPPLYRKPIQRPIYGADDRRLQSNSEPIRQNESMEEDVSEEGPLLVSQAIQQLSLPRTPVSQHRRVTAPINMQARGTSDKKNKTRCGQRGAENVVSSSTDDSSLSSSQDTAPLPPPPPTNTPAEAGQKPVVNFAAGS